MQSLLGNIRFYVLVFSITLSIAIYFWASSIVVLTQAYALAAITYLYFALLAGPFCYKFRSFPYRVKYLKARRAIGVSVFYFGLLHAYFAFFGELGGFAGLGFLSSKYLLAITLSFSALVIFFLMAATAFDFMIERLTFPRWKFLHRFVYLAGIFTLIHALLIGSHFQDLSSLIPLILFAAVSFLLVLEALRFDAFLQRKFSLAPRFRAGLIFIIAVALIYFFKSLLLQG